MSKLQNYLAINISSYFFPLPSAKKHFLILQVFSFFLKKHKIPQVISRKKFVKENLYKKRQGTNVKRKKVASSCFGVCSFSQFHIPFCHIFIASPPLHKNQNFQRGEKRESKVFFLCISCLYKHFSLWIWGKLLNLCQDILIIIKIIASTVKRVRKWEKTSH